MLWSVAGLGALRQQREREQEQQQEKPQTATIATTATSTTKEVEGQERLFFLCVLSFLLELSTPGQFARVV